MKFVVLTATIAISAISTRVMAQQGPSDAPPKPPSVRCLAFSPDGQSLAVAHSENNSLVVWDLTTRQKKFVVHEPSGISSLAYAPRGDALAIGTGSDVKLLDPGSGELRRALNDHKDTVKLRSVAFTPDGQQLVVAANDHTVKLLDLTSGEVQHTFSGFQENVTTVAISPNGKWLATFSGTDGALKLWNLEHPDQPSLASEKGRLDVRQISFSPDNRFLVIPKWAIIDVTSGHEFLRFTHFWDANCAAFSPDGKWIALVTQYRPIDLLGFQPSPTAEQRQRTAVLIEQFQDDDYAKREAASQELAGSGIAALEQLRASLNSTVAEVRVRCRLLVERLQRAEFGAKFVGHNADPSWVAFSPDNALVASGDWQGTVKLWNVADTKELATLESN